jgi:hypothetical protein
MARMEANQEQMRAEMMTKMETRIGFLASQMKADQEKMD